MNSKKNVKIVHNQITNNQLSKDFNLNFIYVGLFAITCVLKKISPYFILNDNTSSLLISFYTITLT